MLSSFLVNLLAEVIGDVDIGDVSIVHDAPRLPSESLRNINRRAMGMEDSHGPICLKTERKERKNRWEGLVGAVPKLAFQQDSASTKKPATRPGLGRRQCSDSMLLRPTRRPFSPRQCSDSMLMSPTRRPSSTRQCSSDSMLLLSPTRRPSSPNSPTRQLLTSGEGLGGGRTATRNLHQWGSSSVSCVLNEEGSGRLTHRP
jgi:hypothetical protein